MKRALIFDADGTLLKSLGLGMEAYNYALEKVGARPHAPEEIKRWFGRGNDKIFLELLKDKKLADKAYDYFIERERLNIGKIIPHDGIVDILEELTKRKIPLAVMTGRNERDLRLHFDYLDLAKYFAAIICDNHVSKSKPDPEGVLLAASRLHMTAQDCFYIGDAVMDMKAAASAGMKSIAALWDEFVKEEDMMKENPGFCARTPYDLLNILNSQVD